MRWGREIVSGSTVDRVCRRSLSVGGHPQQSGQAGRRAGGLHGGGGLRADRAHRRQRQLEPHLPEAAGDHRLPGALQGLGAHLAAPALPQPLGHSVRQRVPPVDPLPWRSCFELGCPISRNDSSKEGLTSPSRPSSIRLSLFLLSCHYYGYALGRRAWSVTEFYRVFFCFVLFCFSQRPEPVLQQRAGGVRDDAAAGAGPVVADGHPARRRAHREESEPVLRRHHRLEPHRQVGPRRPLHRRTRL